MIWYRQNVAKLFEQLESSESGLTASAAETRLKENGLNQLTQKKDSLWLIIIEPFRSVFIAVLVFAAVASILSREPLDAIIISIIILTNTIIFYSQQYATTRVLRSLKKHSVQQVKVVRGGEELLISSIFLVSGDIIILSEGERVAADARVIHSDSLQVNEGSLTGESIPVNKHASTLESSKQIYEQDNMVFQGTYIVSGAAKAIVVETGDKTEFGKIAQISKKDKSKSPVQIKIDNLVKLIVKFATGLAVLVFALALFRGLAFNEALRFVLSVTVSIVPEGLPVALTVIIVLGMRRMAKQKALVRTFRSIEDIGQITTIATDKTGTLTKNELSIVDKWAIGHEDLYQFAAMTIDSSASSADPLDKAIEQRSHQHKAASGAKYYPFDISLRMSGAYLSDKKAIYIKGSPEHMLALSKLDKAKLHLAESKIGELASKGYRVIALAKYQVAGKPPSNLANIGKNNLELVGYIAFADELRDEAKGAIAAAKNAGISVRLITGDHYETAFNIGKQLGLASHPREVIQGIDLPENETTLYNEIAKKTIFARILPVDKFRILKALKRTEITAMTGDGVNDVPALSNAHVGIAMGSGSDISKDAAGIVLIDDNFSTIVGAIAEGRKIFDNIRRMLFYLLATTIGEALTVLGALLLGLPLPVTSIQILWINLVTDTAMVLPLGLEPAEKGLMKRPPRRPNDPLLDNVLLVRMVIVALTMAVMVLTVVYLLSVGGQSKEYIQTVAFMMLITAQWANAFNARSEMDSSFSRLKKPNWALLVGFVVAVASQALVMFGPLGPAFQIVDVPTIVIAQTSGLIVFGVIFVVELHKWIVKKSRA